MATGGVRREAPSFDMVRSMMLNNGVSIVQADCEGAARRSPAEQLQKMGQAVDDE
jgi:hypothetical protein